jgi:hypothetical protein
VWRRPGRVARHVLACRPGAAGARRPPLAARDSTPSTSAAAAQRTADGRCDLARTGREIGRGLVGRGAYVWGVEVAGDAVHASDVLHGLRKLGAPGR